MKKTSCIICLLLCSLCIGCAKKTEKKGTDSDVSSTMFPLNEGETSDAGVSDDEGGENIIESVESSILNPVASKEINEADLYSNKVQFLNNVITLPCKLSDIEKFASYKVDELSGGYDAIQDTFDAFSSNKVVLNIPGGDISLIVENWSSEPVTKSEAWVTGVVSENMYVFFPKGVTVGCEAKNLRVWGDEYEEEYDTYLYDAGSLSSSDYHINDISYGPKFEVILDDETLKVRYIRFSSYVYAENKDYVKNVEYRYTDGQNQYSISGVMPCSQNWYKSIFVIRDEGRDYAVFLDNSSAMSSTNVEDAFAEMAREVYFWDDSWIGNWELTNDYDIEKEIVKEDELPSVLGIYDCRDLDIRGPLYDATGYDISKYYTEENKNIYAKVAFVYNEKTMVQKYVLSAVDGEDIPDEVIKIFKDIMFRYAESLTIYEGK